MRLDYFLYMAEAEGCDDLVSTRTAKLNAIAKDIAAARYKDDYDLDEIFAKHHLSMDSVTEKEIAYLHDKIRKF